MATYIINCEALYNIIRNCTLGHGVHVPEHETDSHHARTVTFMLYFKLPAGSYVTVLVLLCVLYICIHGE